MKSAKVLPASEDVVLLNSDDNKSEEMTNKNINLESWMSKLPEHIRNLPLNYLVIPGSHDSFSYSLSLNGALGADASMTISRLDSICNCITRPIIYRWSVTQSATVTEQLMHGIRYFDIRVGMKDSSPHFVHVLFGQSLHILFEEILTFLKNHHGEVVLLDLQHFYGLTNSDHSLLINLIMTTFQKMLCLYLGDLSNLTLDWLHKNSFQLLVFYRKAVDDDVRWIWPGYYLPNPWPDTTKLSSLIPFLENQLAIRNAGTFFVTQFVLTPDVSYIARNLCSSLSTNLAEPCSLALLQWLPHLSPGPDGPNIVMCDSVDLNNWEVPRTIILRNLE